MSSPNSKVDAYLTNGCGRCSLYKTPACKVHTWQETLTHLRRLVLECGLTEELKWSQPCYTSQNINILLVTAFKNFATLAFFKGALLSDNYNLLVAPGENSQAMRQLRFTGPKQVMDQENIIKQYIFEAIEVEKAGLKIEFKKQPESIPEELVQQFKKQPDLKTAFENLTPGRQRGYLLHFSQPKQSKTRTTRIEKYAPLILNGQGMHDVYKSKK
ncbi:YdeI/OmpD-associated family protein [Maribacter sp. CXY002]|uniref:YdeI/OmpD-associated family protein n=1 Tax=Maribacter luteocoastalis TaxID=3407671 RepID=UPI003B67FAAE